MQESNPKGLPGIMKAPPTHDDPGPISAPLVTDVYKIPHVDVVSPLKLHPLLEAAADHYFFTNKLSEIRAAIESGDANHIVGMFTDFCSAKPIREKTGHNDGTDVDDILYTLGASGKEYAWCVTQWHTAVAYAQAKTGKVSKITKPSLSCLSTLHNAPASCLIKLSDIQYGDGWCWQHGSSANGHWGTFKAWIKVLQTMELNEGNTTAGLVGQAVVREGGGSYLTERSTGVIGDMKPVGILRAF